MSAGAHFQGVPPPVPLGAVFVRGDGDEVTVDATLKAIADSLLASGVYVGKAGHKTVCAVWDAKRTIDTVTAAGFVLVRTEEA